MIELLYYHLDMVPSTSYDRRDTTRSQGPLPRGFLRDYVQTRSGHEVALIEEGEDETGTIGLLQLEKSQKFVFRNCASYAYVEPETDGFTPTLSPIPGQNESETEDSRLDSTRSGKPAEDEDSGESANNSWKSFG
eukprot:UN17852